jgi:hypothetical protein
MNILHIASMDVMGRMAALLEPPVLKCPSLSLCKAFSTKDNYRPASDPSMSYR